MLQSQDMEVLPSSNQAAEGTLSNHEVAHMPHDNPGPPGPASDNLDPPPVPAPSAPAPAVVLSDEQNAILRLVSAGKSIFFTGSAGSVRTSLAVCLAHSREIGTGKSVLLRSIISLCYEMYGRDHVGVTAATGIASINIGGCTLHSWAGIGLGKGNPLGMAKRLIGHDANLKKRAPAEQNNLPVDKQTLTTDRWKNARALIIDESMLRMHKYLGAKLRLTASFHD